MKKKFYLLAPLLLTGCIAAAPIDEVSDLTIVVAEYKLLLAEQQGGSWIESENLLEQAKVAYANGEHKKALELARQARFEGEAALRQNQSQQNASPWQLK